LWVAAIFAGLKSAVIGIVLHALLRIGMKALRHFTLWLVAAAAFVSLYFLRVPFPWIIAGGALAGLLLQRAIPKADHAATPARRESPPARATWAWSVRVLLTCLCLWWLPIAVLALCFGSGSTFVRQGVFFSQAALVTFGGAYAVLPFIAAAAVERFAWLSTGAMLDGLGLAETTPGPLIMVVQFVGFLGGWNHPEGLPPWLAGTLGAAIATWVTFVPCFLWILLGAPHVEGLRHKPGLSAAMTGVTAAVVGVVFNLAVWFAQHALFYAGELRWSALDLPALLAAVAVFIALERWKLSMQAVVAAGALFGLARFFLAP
jgi:chromate transporter